MVKQVNILKKATIADFKKAYEETGYKPCRDSYLDKDKRACPAAVLYISKFGIPKGKNLINKSKKITEYYTEIDSDYLYGFTRGVDNEICYISNHNSTLGYKKGQKIGKSLGLGDYK